MGLFGGYMKEGPGVDKNAPKKKGVFLYIDVVFRKFVNLMGANFMYLICSLPYLALAYVVLSTFVINGLGIDKAIESAASAMVGDAVNYEDAVQMLYFSVRSIITVVLFNFLGSGPVSASYAYITRSYTRGEPIWLMSDGWDKFKENFKHAILLVIVDVIVIALAMNAIAFYSELAAANTGTISSLLLVARYFTIIILFIYMMMHMYAYQIMVTYECDFRELIKASVMMTLAKLPMSVFLTALTGALTVLLMGALSNPLAGLIIYSVIGLTFLRYPLEFYASRVIEKNIKAVKKKEKKKKAKITYMEEA